MTDWRYWITYTGIVKNCADEEEAIEAAQAVIEFGEPATDTQVEPLGERNT